MRIFQPCLSQPTPSIFAQPVSEATAERLKEMMVAAVSSGVSSNAQIDGVRVAGKTGTAQNGEDEPYTLWFTGFAPADNPKIVVSVMVENGESGSGVAAPVVRQVMDAWLLDQDGRLKAEYAGPINAEATAREE